MGVRDKIVAYCKRQIGCTYDYTPSGGVEGKSYNCSYLSTCAYKAAGLAIPSWQGHQNGSGSQSDWVRWHNHWTTDPAKLKAGDLVFFGTSAYDTNHVGIVSRAGNTPYIIDSTPSRGVVERKLPTSAGFVGGGWPMSSYPTDSTDDTEVFAVTDTVTVKSDSLAVRTKPSTKTGTIVDVYAKGDTIAIDGMVIGDDGYIWGSYTGASSGARRYVALGKATLAR